VEKPKASVYPLVAEDLWGLCRLARPADREEIESVAGFSLETAVGLLIPHSCKSQKIVHNGLLLAAVGDAQHLDGLGVPWLISTIHVERYPREFLRATKPLVDEMLGRHQRLQNYVDASNTAAIRWLRWLGFELGTAVPYGHQGKPFIPFKLER